MVAAMVRLLSVLSLIAGMLLPYAAACGRVQPAASIPAASALCRSAILQAERAMHVPDRLLDAIAVVESGRLDPVSGAVYPWPWTINVEGVGHFYESKAEAIAAVQQFQTNGARSIDVGCMQVSLLYHPEAFGSLDQAFDPMNNAGYGARFLVQLFQQTNAWPLAAAAYHSLTPDIGAEYARKVLAAWGVPQLPVSSQIVTAGAQIPPGVAAPIASLIRPNPTMVTSGAVPSVLPSGREAVRMLPAPGIRAAPGVVGRGLDAYRSMPIALSAHVPRPS